MPSTIKNRIIFDADIGDTEANEDNSSTISSRGASIFPKKSKSDQGRVNLEIFETCKKMLSSR